MSALSEANTPAQDGPPPSIDTNQLQGQVQLTADLQQQQNGQPNPQDPPTRKLKSSPTFTVSVGLHSLFHDSKGTFSAPSMHCLPCR